MLKNNAFISLLIALTPGFALAQAPEATAPAATPPGTPPAAAPQAASPAATEPAAAAPSTAPAVVPAAAPVAEPVAASKQGQATPEPAAEKAEEKIPDRVAVGDEGFFQPGVMFQGWFFVSDQSGSVDSTFRIRRAELSAKGELVPKLVSYKVMIDPAKLLKFGSAQAPVVDAAGDPVTPSATVGVLTPPADTSILQDASVTFMSEYADVSVGQFKIPVSFEGVTSASKLLMPERSLVSRALGDKRDIGLKLEKKFEKFGYTLGIFNGPGLNQIDSNNQKDLGLRLEAYPIKGITVAAVGYTSVGSRDEATTKDRLEGDISIDLANALLQAEYIHGWDGPSASRAESHGFYVVGGYKFFDRLQPLVRVGQYDSDVSSADTEKNHYEFGVNYYLRGHQVKFQSTFSIFDSTTPGVETYDEFIVSSQLAF